MESRERIEQALEETEILRSPERLISTEEKTTLHYYVLTEPVYLEVFDGEGPETRIREGWITWEKPKLLTPDYLMKMEGFSEEAQKAMKLIANKNPDLAGFLYQMKYKKNSGSSRTISTTIEEAHERIEEDINEADEYLTAIIKGLDELWDVSLMKFIQQLVLKSAQKTQIPDLERKGYLRYNRKGQPVVTRNLEGLPLAARQEIEKMFAQVEEGDLEPAKLKRELDRWGVYKAYEDRFLDLFKKE